jgi:hypothetical protein
MSWINRKFVRNKTRAKWLNKRNSDRLPLPDSGRRKVFVNVYGISKRANDDLEAGSIEQEQNINRKVEPQSSKGIVSNSSFKNHAKGRVNKHFRVLFPPDLFLVAPSLGRLLG